MRVLEQIRLGKPGQQEVALYLNSKPMDWRLVQWKWTFLPYTDESLTLHTDGDFNGVDATWETPDLPSSPLP